MNLQFFGYTHFLPTLIPPIDSVIYVPTGSLFVTTHVNVNFIYTYLIGNDPNLKNLEFVLQGIYIDVAGDDTLTLDVSQDVELATLM